MLPLYRELRHEAPFHRLFPVFLAEPYPVFLDSSLTHSRLGRYSYISAGPRLVLRCKDGRIVVQRRGHCSLTLGDPFAELSSLLHGVQAETIPGLPPFQGGAIGYFGYDLGQHVEDLPRTTIDDIGLDDMVVGLYDWVLARDHLANRTWLIATPLPGDEDDPALRRIDKVAACIERSPEGVTRARVPDLGAGSRCRSSSPPVASSQSHITGNFTPRRYLDAIAAAKEYIAAGDIYQVCLSQRFQAPLRSSAWELYMRLREVSPVPYGAFLDLGDVAVASASPELFLRLGGRKVETRPIKGTRPRGKTPEEDQRLASELLACEKDRAENVMIVDLLRNDIGRVCQVGSVRPSELWTLESYSTVHHLVSAVEGTLADGQDAVSLLRACFPGGSVTGCPKIRSMEIIDELEPTRRGVYCGSIGFIGFNGNMDTSIVIRTAVVKDGIAYFQVGGAIVADSDPEAEYQETLDKARALILALGCSVP